MKTLLSTTVLTLALIAGGNVSANEQGPVLLTNAQLDAVDAAGRKAPRYKYHKPNTAAFIAVAYDPYYGGLAIGAGKAKAYKGTAIVAATAIVKPHYVKATGYACAGKCY